MGIVVSNRGDGRQTDCAYTAEAEARRNREKNERLRTIMV